MRHIATLSLALAAACAPPSTTSDDTGETGADALSWPTLSCDPIVDYCGFPFPNNVFTAPDDSTPTGLRVALDAETMPNSTFGDGTDPAPFNTADGFSPGSPILAHLPGATGTGLVPAHDVGLSQELDALTLILDPETMTPVLHWAEVDRLKNSGPGDQTFFLQPAVRLDDAKRYIVAIRGVVDENGDELPPSDAMQGYLDGGDASDPRTASMEDLLSTIDRMPGWSRDDVQLAWDFTTRSKQDITQWLVHMRDRALEITGEDGPEYTITSVEDDWNSDHIAYRIQGTFEAPLFLSGVEPGAQLLFGDDGLPTVNADDPTMTVAFEAMIPNSAVSDEAKPLLMYGHGLFGEKEQIESSHFRSFIDDYGYVMFGIDLIGMASDDGAWLENPATTPLLQAKMHEVVRFHDRLHQGFLNHLLAMRMMKARFAEDDTYGAMINGETSHYHGISQGGIMGVVHAALSPDIDRAALGVMGQPYAVLLPRSVDFAPFFDILDLALDDGRDLALALALAQQTWTRVEPDGWSAYLTRDTVDEDTAPKKVFLRAARGDHQVSNWGAHTMARTLRASHLGSGLRSVHGLNPTSRGNGSATYVEYDFGLPDEPPCNVPMSLCDDPHGKVRPLEAARRQLHKFLSEGIVANFCEEGDGEDCTYPDLSGCEMSEDQAAADALCDPE